MDYKFDEIDKKWFDHCAKEPDKYVIRESYDEWKCKLNYQIIDDFTGEILHTFTMPSEEFAKQVLDYCGCRVVEE